MTRKSDDTIFYKIKKRLAEEAEKKETDIDTLLKIANTLTKMKAVELKMQEGEYGSEFDNLDDTGA